MSSTAQAILITSQRYTICVSFLILFAGLFGHTCNMITFTQLKMFRGNPAAAYLIAESVMNSLQMLIPFTSRIAINGFGHDLTQTSSLWCKLRQVITQAITLISLSIICFASIDQYLSTSYQPYRRQMSTIRLARVLISTSAILWILHGIPVGIFFRIHSVNGCSISNPNMIIYGTYVYYLLLTGALPIIISTLFSVLAYQNVRRIIRRQIPIRRRKRDQQLTAMIIARVAFLVITTVPYVLERIYTLSVRNHKHDLIHKAMKQLVAAVTISLFYLNYAVGYDTHTHVLHTFYRLFQGSFYIFLISSSRFRRQVRYALINKCWKPCWKTPNQDHQYSTTSQIQSTDNDSQTIT